MFHPLESCMRAAFRHASASLSAFVVAACLAAGCSLIVDSNLDDPPEKRDDGGVDAATGDGTVLPDGDVSDGQPSATIVTWTDETGRPEPDYLLSGEKVELQLEGFPNHGADYEVTVDFGPEGIPSTEPQLIPPGADDGRIAVVMPTHWPTGSIKITVSRGGASDSIDTQLAKYVFGVEDGGQLHAWAVIGENPVGAGEQIQSPCHNGSNRGMKLLNDGRWALTGWLCEGGQLKLAALHIPSLTLSDATIRSVSGVEEVCLLKNPQQGKAVEGFVTCETAASPGDWDVCRLAVEMEGNSPKVSLMTQGVPGLPNPLDGGVTGSACAITESQEHLIVGGEAAGFRLAILPLPDLSSIEVVRQDCSGGTLDFLAVGVLGVPVPMRGKANHFLVPDGTVESSKVMVIDAPEACVEMSGASVDAPVRKLIYSPVDDKIALATMGQAPLNDGDINVYSLVLDTPPSVNLVNREIEAGVTGAFDGTWTRPVEGDGATIAVMWQKSGSNSNVWIIPVTSGTGAVSIGEPGPLNIQANVADVAADPGAPGILYVATESEIARVDIHSQPPTVSDFDQGMVGFTRVYVQP